MKKELNKGDQVKINVGKHAGIVGVVTEVVDSKINVQIPGLEFERSFYCPDLEFVGKTDLYQTSGEIRRKKMQAMVKNGLLCPSYPHVCTGSCGLIEHKKSSAAN